MQPDLTPVPYKKFSVPALSFDQESLSSLMDIFIATQLHHLAPLTKKYIRYKLEVFVIFVGNRSLTPELLDAYPAWLKGAKPFKKPIHYFIRYVWEAKRFLKWLYRSGRSQYDYSVFFPTDMVYIKKAKPQTFSHDEYLKLIEAATGQYLKFKWPMMLAYNTGMSLIDCAHLRWANIAMDEDPIVIRANRIKMANTPHNQDIFTVPVLPDSDLYDAIMELWNNRDKYKNANDQYVSPNLLQYYTYGVRSIYKEFQRFIQDVVGGKRTFKHFRNTFVSNMANSGMNLGLACKLTGHKNPKVYLGYIKPDNAALASLVAKGMEHAKNKPVKIKRKQNE